jgi:hypothetical protein
MSESSHQENRGLTQAEATITYSLWQIVIYMLKLGSIGFDRFSYHCDRAS